MIKYCTFSGKGLSVIVVMYYGTFFNVLNFEDRFATPVLYNIVLCYNNILIY